MTCKDKTACDRFYAALEKQEPHIRREGNEIIIQKSSEEEVQAYCARFNPVNTHTGTKAESNFSVLQKEQGLQTPSPPSNPVPQRPSISRDTLKEVRISGLSEGACTTLMGNLSSGKHKIQREEGTNELIVSFSSAKDAKDFLHRYQDSGRPGVAEIHYNVLLREKGPNSSVLPRSPVSASSLPVTPEQRELGLPPAQPRTAQAAPSLEGGATSADSSIPEITKQELRITNLSETEQTALLEMCGGRKEGKDVIISFKTEQEAQDWQIQYGQGKVGAAAKHGIAIINYAFLMRQRRTSK